MNVCPDCIGDYAIKDFINGNLSEKDCDYCGNASQSDDIAASLEDVVEFIIEGIQYEWDEPGNCVGWCSAEGGWVGATVLDTYDLIFEDHLELEVENTDLLNDIFQSLNREYPQWCRKDPYGPEPGEELLLNWSRFADQIKHHVRFVFYRTRAWAYGERDVLERHQPHEILNKLGEIVKDLSLIQTISINTAFVRARIGQKKIPASVKQLGPPPKEKAIYSNRMSPAGIPMFYGSLDEQTAISETYDKKSKSGKIATVATFITRQAFKVLDLTRLPAFPSLFDEEKRHYREPLIFLRSFLKDFSKPIKKDGREHIEYVPTQVVTEYFRHIIRDEGRDTIKGIIYPSAKKKNGGSCVLFFENKDCVQDNIIPKGADNKWLMMLRASVKSIKLK